MIRILTLAATLLTTTAYAESFEDAVEREIRNGTPAGVAIGSAQYLMYDLNCEKLPVGLVNLAQQAAWLEIEAALSAG